MEGFVHKMLYFCELVDEIWCISNKWRCCWKFCGFCGINRVTRFYFIDDELLINKYKLRRQWYASNEFLLNLTKVMRFVIYYLLNIINVLNFNLERFTQNITVIRLISVNSTIDDIMIWFIQYIISESV